MLHIGIQARSGSTRFPNKMTQAMIFGHPLIQHVCNIADQSGIDYAVLVPEGDPLRLWCRDHHVQYWEGSETDLISRYVSYGKSVKAGHVVRITGDCPLVPLAQLTHLAGLAQQGPYDYVTNRPCWDGGEIDILSMRAWEWQDKNATDDADREHACEYVRRNLRQFLADGFTYQQYVDPIGMEAHKLSIDTEEDLNFVREWYANEILQRIYRG